jgi:hypothetical protein
MANLGVSVGGDTLGHVLALGTNDGGDFTPDGIAAAVEKVHAQIRLLSKEVFAADDVDDAFFTDWSHYVLAFTTWKTSHSSWLSRAWNETRTELLDLVAQYEALRSRWGDLHGETAAVPFEVTTAPGGTLENMGLQIGLALKHVGIGLAILVGVPLLGYVAWRVVKA